MSKKVYLYKDECGNIHFRDIKLVTNDLVTKFYCYVGSLDLPVITIDKEPSADYEKNKIFLEIEWLLVKIKKQLEQL